MYKQPGTSCQYLVDNTPAFCHTLCPHNHQIHLLHYETEQKEPTTTHSITVLAGKHEATCSEQVEILVCNLPIRQLQPCLE